MPAIQRGGGGSNSNVAGMPGTSVSLTLKPEYAGDVIEPPPLGGYKPDRNYKPEGEWVRGDPSPLGLICFGMTTSMLMFVTTTWAQPVFLPTVIYYALAFGGSGQLIAGILDLIKGNTWGGTVFASYGCFWLGFGMLNRDSSVYPTAYPSESKTGWSLFYGLWALLTLIFFITALRKTASIQTVLSTLVICFVLLSGGVWNAQCNQAAGYVGAFCALSAIYAAMAVLVKNELGYILPGVRPTHYFKHPLDYLLYKVEQQEREQEMADKKNGLTRHDSLQKPGQP